MIFELQMKSSSDSSGFGRKTSRILSARGLSAHVGAAGSHSPCLHKPAAVGPFCSLRI